jgi:hypothetical protein
MSVGPDEAVQRPLRRARSAPDLTKRAQKPARPLDGLHFRVEFLSSSMGTEQELDGVIIKRAMNAGRKIGEVLRNGQTLLLITTDMVRSKVGDDVLCTLEIITTPTESDDELGWAYRTEAFSLLITEIETVAKRHGGKGGALSSDLLGVKSGYLMLICNPNHAISMANPQSNVVITSTDRQGTLGVPVADMLDPAFHLAGGMETPEWYDSEAEIWAMDLWPGQPTKQLAYALVESGIQKCVLLMQGDQAVVDAVWEVEAALRLMTRVKMVCLEVIHLPADDPNKVNALGLFQEADDAVTNALTTAAEAVAKLMASPAWKNGWKPLPRTPLIALLNQLPDADAQDVLAELEKFLADRQDPVINWAKGHILRGFRLGGHDITPPIIACGHGFLLEYRGAKPDNFTDKFYYAPGEAGIYVAPMTPKARRVQAEAAAAAAAERERRRKNL